MAATPASGRKSKRSRGLRTPTTEAAARTTPRSRRCWKASRGAHGTDWSRNKYNDDIAWAVIAYTRGYQSTKNAAFLTIAQANFDRMFARAWNPAKATLYWTTDNTSYNSCIECPAGIAAYLLSVTLNDSSYRTRAQNLFAWEKANLFDPKSGAVWDAVNLSGKIGTWSSTYNQGTFVGLANFLGDTDSAKRAADYTMNRLGKRAASGYTIMPEYGAGGDNNSGLNSIGLRWISRFMKDQHRQTDYLPWLQANADTAWSVRRPGDNLSWCQWLRPTPDGVLHSWDCINSVVALQVTADAAHAGNKALRIAKLYPLIRLARTRSKSSGVSTDSGTRSVSTIRMR